MGNDDPVKAKLSQNVFETVKISPKLFQEEVKEQISKVFKTYSVEVTGDFPSVSASSNPFPHCLVKDFLHEDGGGADDFVKDLLDDLTQLKFHEKSNDLYKFIQTDELFLSKSRDATNISTRLKHFASLIKNHMLPWLRDVTDVCLDDDVTMFCAQYSSTDCLLCHDDQLENRCIAYVYYLTPDWLAHDGGELQLFNEVLANSGTLEPHHVVKSIVPMSNSLVFFQVSPKSFHQVAEVLSEMKTRISLTGWFHGPAISTPLPAKDPKLPVMTFIPASDGSVLSSWINPVYLSLSTQGEMQEQFVEDSEIKLNNFLLESKLDKIHGSLKLLEECRRWEMQGPPNKRHYHKLLLQPKWDQQSSGENSAAKEEIKEAINFLQTFVDVFSSEEIFLYLSNTTGLTFHPMAVDSESDDSDDDITPEKRQKRIEKKRETPGCRLDLRRWCPGSYTLIKDTDAERGEFALDVNLFFCQSEWKEEYGGYTSYIASDEAEELLTIVPANNCLSMTYRDKDAMRFVKHVNHTAPLPFYDLSAVYYE
ncbi:prolyl 3-hydroxylase OGFOD1-like isoform X2 [Clavelina lepadiformis]|uniref:prolyl 3-hydroxylase OGFOD1-like isoform X2 n=1 Tax=Clavelina lepadiformis TaxID=159417 RepID=UPI0040415C4B